MLHIKRKKKFIYSIIFLVGIGIIIELYTFYIGPLKTVSENYIFYVYAAIVTMCSISATLITIIINSFDKKYFGFSVKEIIGFRSSEFNAINIIPLSFTTILVATLFLVFNLINMTTVTIIITAIMIITYSNYLWNIATSDEQCINSIKNEFLSTVRKIENNRLIEIINKILHSYSENIDKNRLEYGDEILEFIKQLLKNTDANNSLMIDFNRSIEEAFEILVPKIGFGLSVDKLLSLYNDFKILNNVYDRRYILLKPIEKIRFYDDEYLLKYSIVDFLNAIEYSDILDMKEKIFCLYQIFKSLELNNRITVFNKEEQLKCFFNHVCKFSSSYDQEYDEIREKVILNIFKDYILLNENSESRGQILNELNSKMFKYGKFRSRNNSTKYYDTLAILYYSLYTYAFYEVETLSAEYREEISSLINKKSHGIDNIKISLKNVILENIEAITNSLWSSSVDCHDKYHFLEYHPDYIFAKTSIWIEKNLIEFSFINYLLFFNYMTDMPHLYVKKWDGLEWRTRKRILNILIDFFDFDSKNLVNDKRQELNELSNWLGLRGFRDEKVIMEIYRSINEELKEVKKHEIETILDSKPINDEILSELDRQLKSNHYYGYRVDGSFNNLKSISMAPRIEKKEFCNNEVNVAEYIRICIANVVNEEVSKLLPRLRLGFELKDIIDLNNKLIKKKYDSYNYRYINDLAFNIKIRANAKYEELVSRLDSMQLVSTFPFSFYMYFNQDSLTYKIDNLIHELRVLSDEECDAFTENFRIANGVYRYEKILYNKESLMDVIKESYCIQTIQFDLYHNISKNCGIIVQSN